MGIKRIYFYFLLFFLLLGMGNNCSRMQSGIKGTSADFVIPSNINHKLAIANGLKKLSQHFPDIPIRVSVGSITFEETEFASKFASYFRNELKIALSNSKEFDVFERTKLDPILREQQLSLSDLLNEETKVDVGQLQGLQAILSCTYWIEPKDIKIYFDLTNIETGQIYATSILLEKRYLPNGISLHPQNLHLISQAYNNFQNDTKRNCQDFKIRVWVDKGNGGVYTIGEKLLIFFKANHDCFLKLYHTDSAGNIIQLFPNQYSRDNFIKAGRVYVIPDESYNFDFVIKLPLGSEIIKAIASLQPFSTKDDFSANEVFKSLGSASKNNIRGILTRDIGIKGRKGVAEDMCVFTTVKF